MMCVKLEMLNTYIISLGIGINEVCLSRLRDGGGGAIADGGRRATGDTFLQIVPTS